MTNREFMIALGNIDDELITNAKPVKEAPETVKPGKTRPWKIVAAAAACVAAVFVGVFAFNKVYAKRVESVDSNASESGSVEPGAVLKAERLELGDDWKKTVEFTLPEFPEATFVKTETHLSLAETSRSLFGAPGILSVYFADLNGDGKREIVSDCWDGLSGMSRPYVMAYDHVNSKAYWLGDRQWFYSLELRDGVLYAIGDYVGDEHTETPLTLDMMKAFETDDETVVYEGKGYVISNTLYTGDGVEFMVGFGEPGLLFPATNYEAGRFVELLCMVENNSDKEIWLQTPVIGGDYNFEFDVTIKQNNNQLVELYDENIKYGMDDAMGKTSVKPGERFAHVMRFDTLKERLDDDAMIIFQQMPSGVYDGTAGITVFTDPNADYSDDMRCVLDFRLVITESHTIEAPERGVFTMDEFGNYVKFSYNDQGVWADDSQKEFKLFDSTWVDKLYLIDMNGDGIREICASILYGSERTGRRIEVYDFKNEKLYELADHGHYDYIMVANEHTLKYQKLKCNSGELVREGNLTLDVMKEITKQSDGIQQSFGALEVTIRDDTVTMPDFSDKRFYVSERSLKMLNEDGTEDEMFNTKIENVYFCDLNADGRCEIIVKGYCNVLVGNTGETLYDAEKIITVFDIENDCGINLYPNSKDVSPVIQNGALYLSIDGELDRDPLTYERFEELAKSPPL